jgi:hypothetical protein
VTFLWMLPYGVPPERGGWAGMTPVPAHRDLVLINKLVPTDRPFSAEQVAVSRQSLAELVRQGHLRRVVRGVFVASSVRDTLGLRARALSLVVPPDAVVTDRTAAWLHGVDVLLPGEHQAVPPVQVFDRKKGGRLRRPGTLSGQRIMPDADVMTIDGVRVTTPLRTAMDLGRTRQAERGFAQTEAMVRAGVDRDDICNALDRFRGYRWIRALRSFAGLLDPRPQSIPESILRFRWYRTCTPYPEPQRPVRGPEQQPWALDLGVDDLFFAVEYDGREFHDGPDARVHDAQRRNWIRRNTPWTIEVVRQENLFGPTADFDLLLPGWIRAARASLGQRLARPRWYDQVGD